MLVDVYHYWGLCHTTWQWFISVCLIRWYVAIHFEKALQKKKSKYVKLGTRPGSLTHFENKNQSWLNLYGGWFVPFRYFLISWRGRKDEGEKTQNCVFLSILLRHEITKRRKFASFRLHFEITPGNIASFRYFVAKSKSANLRLFVI